jgi:hypothetical protein
MIILALKFFRPVENANPINDVICIILFMGFKSSGQWRGFPQASALYRPVVYKYRTVSSRQSSQPTIAGL